MLRHTFLHVPGIGEKRERDLWTRGFADWSAFREAYPPGPWRELILDRLDDEKAARALPAREAWRLARAFPSRTLYLDIETTGLSLDADAVTCIGTSDGHRVRAFIRGRDLDQFPDALEDISLLVTYNGSAFDLPVLRRAFPDVDFDRFHHIDLRYPLGRLGVRGGLKGAERQLGIARPEELNGVDGFTAVLLWQEHLAGHQAALDTLVRYCLEDVVNLVPLLALTFNRFTASMPLGIAPMPATVRPEIPYAANAALVGALARKKAWA